MLRLLLRQMWAHLESLLMALQGCPAWSWIEGKCFKDQKRDKGLFWSSAFYICDIYWGTICGFSKWSVEVQLWFLHIFRRTCRENIALKYLSSAKIWWRVLLWFSVTFIILISLHPCRLRMKEDIHNCGIQKLSVQYR